MTDDMTPAQNKARLTAASLLTALAGMMLCAALLGFERHTGYRMLWAVAFGLLAVGGARFWTLRRRREKALYGLFAFLFVSAQALGYRMERAGTMGLQGLALCAGIGLCFAPGAGWALRWLANALCRGGTKLGLRPRAAFWLAFAVISLCWLPVFLAYYPGLFAYDVHTQIGEILSGQLTTRNPLLHTLLLGGLYRLGEAAGDPSLGVAAFVLLQMLAMATSFAWLLRYLSTLACNRLLYAASLAAFALLPIHSMLAVSCTKDTLFCGVLLLYAIRLHRLSRAPGLLGKPRFCVVTLLIAALLCMLRNNAFFCVLMCIPLGLLITPKGLRLRLTALVCASLVAFLGLNAGLKAAFNASGISSTELVSVPSQQLGLVYQRHKDELPASVEIEYYLPTVQNYKPYTADPVKSVAVVNRAYRMWGFLKLWGRIGLQYPMDYLDAFLLNTRGYWWLDDTTHAAIYGEGLKERQGYLLSDTKPGLGVVHKSLFPALETLYERLFSANEYQRAPVLSLLFAPSLYGWLTALLLCRALAKRNRACAMLCGFLLSYMLPLVFGACVLIRYAYPMVVCIPLMIFSAAENTREVTQA